MWTPGSVEVQNLDIFSDCLKTPTWLDQASKKPCKKDLFYTVFFWQENVVNFPQAAPDEQETPKRGIWHRPKKKANLRRGDESQELVGTGRRERRGWEGFRRGLVEEAAVRGYIECCFGIRGEREGMCRRLDILYLTLHMWHFTFHTGLVRR